MKMEHNKCLSIYLRIHERLTEYADRNGEIACAELRYRILNTKLTRKIFKGIMRELISLGLIEKINKHKYRIVKIIKKS